MRFDSDSHKAHTFRRSRGATDFAPVLPSSRHATQRKSWSCITCASSTFCRCAEELDSPDSQGRPDVCC
ncbi:hypothetical protein CgunFtcFv8_017246 [Champsocephalus gunnari]|uniref:Uncharacterized protein n=1 Tax=Champsocephalus gunnari TaxID=52237 RepID=A0AAN8DMD3_CHAGU|nr:hypothetical protein CgunFtcFv8_017246 [Champsocephalus gunnari]